MTESLEMYLETISLLHERIRIARVTDIAQELGVSKSSVHTALHELERRGLIDHEHYGEIYLTEEGKAASAAIRDRHALLTSFFRDLLGVSARIAEEDACRIEHYLSEETISKISEAVGRAGSSAGATETAPGKTGMTFSALGSLGQATEGGRAGAKGLALLGKSETRAANQRRPRVNWVPVEPEWKPGPRKPKPKSGN